MIGGLISVGEGLGWGYRGFWTGIRRQRLFVQLTAFWVTRLTEAPVILHVR